MSPSTTVCVLILLYIISVPSSYCHLLYICPHPTIWQVGVANVVVDTAAFEHFGDAPLTALEVYFCFY
jgi:hypothetical protein